MSSQNSEAVLIASSLFIEIWNNMVRVTHLELLDLESVFNDNGDSLRTTSLKCSYEQGTWKTGAFEQCGIQSEASNILIYVT